MAATTEDAVKLNDGAFSQLDEDEKHALLEARHHLKHAQASVEQLEKIVEQHGETDDTTAARAEVMSTRDGAQARVDVLTIRLNAKYPPVYRRRTDDRQAELELEEGAPDAG